MRPGPSAPLLTTLVSVNPIYASFNADEQVVSRALKTLADEKTPGDIDRIPVHMTTVTDSAPVKGRMQFIDNQVDRAQRHGAGARHVRQCRWSLDARPVRAAHNGPA